MSSSSSFYGQNYVPEELKLARDLLAQIEIDRVAMAVAVAAAEADRSDVSDMAAAVAVNRSATDAARDATLLALDEAGNIVVQVTALKVAAEAAATDAAESKTDAEEAKNLTDINRAIVEAAQTDVATKQAIASAAASSAANSAALAMTFIPSNYVPKTGGIYTGSLIFEGTSTFTGNAVFQGNTTTIDSTVMTLADPIITLGSNSTTTYDGKDRGIEFKYGNGSAIKTGFFGFDASAGQFNLIADATNTNEVFSGTKATLSADLNGNASTATVLATARTIALTGDVTGSVSFNGSGNVSITTTAAGKANIAAPTFTTGLSINAAAGVYRPVTFQTAGSGRWTFQVNNVAETGSNAGSDFEITRHNDAGTYLGTALSIIRSTGAISLGVRPTWAGYTPWDSNNFTPSTKANVAAPAFTGIFSVGTSAALAAAGTTQGTATTIVNSKSFVTTGTGGVVFPAGAAIGTELKIVNATGSAINVYPNSGGTIGSLAANAPFVLGAGAALEFGNSTSTQWFAFTGVYA